jgi:hypothetical protein
MMGKTGRISMVILIQGLNICRKNINNIQFILDLSC